MALVLVANTDQTLAQQQNSTGRVLLVRRIYDAQAVYQGPAPDPISPYLHHTLGYQRNVHPDLFTEFSPASFSRVDAMTSLKTARYPNNLQTRQVLDPFLRCNGALAVFGGIVPRGSDTWTNYGRRVHGIVDELMRYEPGALKKDEIINAHKGGTRLGKHFWEQKCGLACTTVALASVGWNNNLTAEFSLASLQHINPEAYWCFVIPTLYWIHRTYWCPEVDLTVQGMLNFNIGSFLRSSKERKNNWGWFSVQHITDTRINNPNNQLEEKDKPMAKGMEIRFGRIHGYLRRDFMVQRRPTKEGTKPNQMHVSAAERASLFPVLQEQGGFLVTMYNKN